MFCRCANGFGGGENTQTCPVCLGFPGALPVPTETALEWTIKLGLALDCEIASRAVFARKNYFYPDLPKGYQISQYDLPSCINGKVLVPTPDGDHEVGIVRAHLEEDAAKTTHVGGRTGRIGGADYSLVDFNRGGTPLVEIVTGPDVHSVRGRTPLPAASAADDRRARDLGRRDGEGDAASRRQRLGPAGGIVGAAHPLRAEEHELVPLRRAGDRRGGRAADRRLRVRRRGRAGDLRLRRRQRHADRAAVEGGGRRLPLLPRARPRPDRAACGAGRTSAGRGAGEPGAADPADRGRSRSRPCRRPRHRRPRPALAGDGRGRRRARAGGECDRQPPGRRRHGGRRSGGAREARRGSGPDPAEPRSTKRSERSPSRASPPSRTSRRRPSPTRPSWSRSSRRSSRPTPGKSRPIAAARRGSSASSSAR